MAFPASQQIQADALQKARREALNLKRTMQTRRDALASRDVEASLVLAILKGVTASIATFDEVASVPGIGEYAQGQYEDATLDIAAEFSAMRSAAVVVRNWITTNLPQDTDGYLLLRSAGADGSIVDRMFTPTQTTGLRTQMDALIATIS